MNKPFLPFIPDMLAMGVPEETASRWHETIWMLKSHAEILAEMIEHNYKQDDLRQAAENFREAMKEMQKVREDEIGDKQ